MATIAEILVKVGQLQGLSDDLSAKQTSSHDAVANVTVVHDTEQAKIDAATAAFTIAVNEAQAEADLAVAATEEAKTELDTLIAEIEADLESLKTPAP